MKYSIIIATLNEEKGIAKVINSIPLEIKKEAEIIVADVSTDSTPIIAEKLGARVIRMKEKGKGRQMREAVKQSNGEILIFMDGDATYSGKYIPFLLEKIQNANIVLACQSWERFPKDDILAVAAYWFYAFFCLPPFWLLGVRVADPLAGFRVIRRSDWNILDLKSDYFEIETEMDLKALKKNFIIKDIHVPNTKRAGGMMNSGFFASPDMWFRILRMIIVYGLEKKI